GAVGEAMGLVAEAREEEERGGVAAEGDGVLLPGKVDAVDEGLAGDVLLLLGEGDDGQLVKAEVVGGGERDAELPAATVDDEEIRQLPVDALTGGGSSSVCEGR